MRSLWYGYVPGWSPVVGTGLDWRRYVVWLFLAGWLLGRQRRVRIFIKLVCMEFFDVHGADDDTLLPFLASIGWAWAACGLGIFLGGV